METVVYYVISSIKKNTGLNTYDLNIGLQFLLKCYLLIYYALLKFPLINCCLLLTSTFFLDHLLVNKYSVNTADIMWHLKLQSIRSWVLNH